MLPGFGWRNMAQSWSSNRHELVNHFRGWNYVAIAARAESIAEMHPRVARVHSQKQVDEERHKAWFLGIDHEHRRERLAKVNLKYLPRHIRKNAMANIQAGDELEPVEPEHRLLRLLKNPNGPDVAWTFFYKLEMYLRLCGNAYIWAIPGRDGLPAELWMLPPHWVRSVSSDSELVAEYEIRAVNGYIVTQEGIGWHGGAAGVTRVPADQIISIAYPNPLHFTDGYSPLTAVSSWIDNSENIESSRLAQFANSAMPGVVIEVANDTEDFTEDQAAALKERIKSAYVGVKKTGEVVVLSPGVTMRPIGWNPTEMSYVESANQMKDWLLAAHKTAQSIVGLSDQTTFASMVASRANFYQTTIKPELSLLSQVLTEKLASRFEDNLIIYWDDPTPSDPAMKLQENQALTGMGAKTPNEVRTDYGLEPFPFGGDDPMPPMAAAPMPWATGEEPEPMPGQLGGKLAELAGDDKPKAALGEDGDKSPLNRLGQLMSANGNGRH